ncbi:type II toxin-antitoxin system VapC family toxin [Jiangella mangrovi]|uniref:Ribonuclease VapC n=1 Tax=Jiangella mangrovi TaxID=1524084 RepID=A0A7W9GTA6_9ACTN|nr:type II toxin-antitoxin system VapC family toxin [Jiangella mangrovi]MBB5789306.1 putative nucleic acid-binding protein [Jiangella mangrovi]
MTLVVLDTDIASLILKGRLPSGWRHELAGRLPVLTFVTVGELTQWAELRSWASQRRNQVDAWVDGRAIVEATDEVARLWGRLSARAAGRGRPRPANDTWIAACCIREGIPLATLNRKDFADFAEHEDLRLLTGT